MILKIFNFSHVIWDFEVFSCLLILWICLRFWILSLTFELLHFLVAAFEFLNCVMKFKFFKIYSCDIRVFEIFSWSIFPTFEFRCYNSWNLNFQKCSCLLSFCGFSYDIRVLNFLDNIRSFQLFHYCWVEIIFSSEHHYCLAGFKCNLQH